MRQQDTKDPSLLAVFEKMVNMPENQGYQFTSVDDTNVNGETPLHIAASWGDVGIGKVLLDAGANPNWPDEHHGNTPLHKAVSSKRSDCVDLLLSRDASPEFPNNENLSPLALAKRSGDAKLIAILSSSPRDPDKSKRPEVLVALKHASDTADNAGYVFKDVRDTNLIGDTALHVAAGRGDLDLGRVLLEASANPNARGEYGNTPLHEAVGQRKHEIVKLLLAHGAAKNARNEDGLTPLDIARLSGDPGLVELVST